MSRVVSRAAAIRKLRDAFLARTDQEHAMCDVASRDRIFCGGFRAWSDEDLRKRFSTLEARRPGLPRVAFEELANKWQLGRQIVHGSTLACDVQTKEHGTCLGWDAFSNADLERFCAEVLGESLAVTETGATEA
jgi:hypothetical protein